MKIGKLFLATLLMAAVILPASAQDRQYDVKLTVYPKEEVKEKQQEKQKKEKTLRAENRKAKKEQRAQERHERVFYNEPAQIEPAHKGQPGAAPVRPVVAEVTYEENSNNPYEAVDVIHPEEPVKIKPQHVTNPRNPVRPQISHDPVAGCEKACAEGCACCGEKCGKACDKPCCEKKCEKGCAEKTCEKGGNACPEGKPMACKMGMGHHGHHGPMPVFHNNAQYRDYRKMLKKACIAESIKGESDRFYVGTNALADLMLAPNAQFEWRRDEKMGLRLTVGGFYMPWLSNDCDSNGAGGFWVTPEIRWYLGAKKAWYAGAMAQFGYLCNSYEDATYSMYAYPAETRTVKEKAMAISAGGTFGYMQRINRSFGIDYNVGVGISAIGYDNGYDSTKWNAAFSFTQVGISLLWQVCGK